MRRLLASLLPAALVALSATAALAQLDAYGRQVTPVPGYGSYDRGYYDRGYYDRDSYSRSPYPYAPAPRYSEPPPYAPYGYDPYQSAQRGGGLRILEAWYGRGRRVCDASHSLRSACEGRGSCTVKAGNELCGDPLPGVVKGLSVTYACHGRTLRVDEREPGHLGLRC